MSDDKDENQRVAFAVLFGVILLAIGLAVGMGVWKTLKRTPAGAGAVAGAPAMPGLAAAAGGAAGGAAMVGAAGTAGAAPAGAPAVVVEEDRASVRVDNGVVKFYFASGSAELAAGAREALADIVRGVATGKTASISGYHDTTGDPAKNEELAKQRAFAVRDALKSLGIGDDKLDLRKPAVTTGGGSNAEARRVEVALL